MHHNYADIKRSVMNKTYKNLALSLVFSLLLSVILVAPVHARESTSGGEAGTSSSSDSSDDSDVRAFNQEELNRKVDDIKKQAEDSVNKLEAARAAVKNRTDKERQKICEEKSADITKKLNKKIADANKHKAVFDKIFTRIKDFKEAKQLSPSNYDALVASATNAQTAAANSIAALQAFEVTVDCTQIDDATKKLAGFKEALSQTRDSLKEYKTAVKNVIVAVKTSISTTSTETN